MNIKETKHFNGDEYTVINYGRDYFSRTLAYGILRNGNAVDPKSLSQEVNDWIDSIVAIWKLID